MTDNEIETAIQAKGADVAPRVTLADIEGAIQQEIYFTGADGAAMAAGDGRGIFNHVTNESDAMATLNRLTFCVLIMRSGYSVVGTSACVSADNFDAELGRKIARQNAIDQCWPLFGFHLAQLLART
jgi:photosystem II stability/assembly factor-like uncharacterized protein